jgi:hypothetical protein
MELKDYLLIELDGLERQLKRVTDGLTHTEVCWQPDRGCNSIGLILYHMARSEDMFVQPAPTIRRRRWTGSPSPTCPRR